MCSQIQSYKGRFYSAENVTEKSASITKEFIEECSFNYLFYYRSPMFGDILDGKIDKLKYNIQIKTPYLIFDWYYQLYVSFGVD